MGNWRYRLAQWIYPTKHIDTGKALRRLGRWVEDHEAWCCVISVDYSFRDQLVRDLVVERRVINTVEFGRINKYAIQVPVLDDYVYVIADTKIDIIEDEVMENG